MKHKIRAALKGIISLSLIALLFYIRKDSLGVIVTAIKRLDPWLFASGCALFLIAVSILSVRLNLLLNAQGLNLKLRETVYLSFIGCFFNNFLPTAIGGDVVKAYYTIKSTNKRLGSVASVFMDRFTGFLSLFIMGGISLAFSYKSLKTGFLVLPIVAILVLLIFSLIVFFNRRFAIFLSPVARMIKFQVLISKAGKMYDALNAFKDKRGTMIKAFLVSFAAQVTSFSVIYLLLRGMGVSIPLGIVLSLMPLVSIASMLPSINGLGIREGAIYFLFGPYVGYENAFALSMLWLFMLLLASLAGGASYLLKKDKKKAEVLQCQRY